MNAEEPNGLKTAPQAAEWSLWIEPLDDGGPPDRELRLGFDTTARTPVKGQLPV